MSNQISITSGAKVRNLEGVLTGSSGVVSSLGINVPSGIPQLDGSGKILVSQLPNSVMEYKGTWNAATNTPTLANGTGNQGDVYLCEVAGTVNFGAGPITFNVGDQVIYSGSIWQRASGATGTVTSVALTESGDSLNITGSPITTSGTINIGFNGNSGQYINGAGNLTTFPSLTGFVPYTGATTNVDLGTYGLLADYLKLNVLPTSIPTTESTMAWNDTDGTMDIKLKGGNVTLQVGQEQVARVVNKSGASLLEADYKVVRIRSVAEGGAQGQRLAVVLAQGDTAAHSKGVLGLVTETIADNQEGFITINGQVHEIDTTGTLQGETWVDGEKLYLSETTAGKLTKTPPVAPNHAVIVGYVEYAHAVHGKIFVNVNEGLSLDELQNVYAPSPTNNQSIWWNASTLRYENNTIAGILGYTPANAATTISTTAPLSGGGDLSTNRTLSISQATASTNGYLSSTDWNTFNNKQNAIGYTPANDALVVHLSGAETITGIKTFSNEALFGNGITLTGGYITYTSGIYNLTLNTNILTANRNIFLKDGSGTLAFTSDIPSLSGYVQGSGTTNYLPKFTGASTIGNSLVYDNGTNVGIGTNSPNALLEVTSRIVASNGGGASRVALNIESNGIGTSYSAINSYNYGTAAGRPLAINESGGNVMINTTTDAGYKLDVNGTGRFTGALSGTSATFSGQVNIFNSAALRLARFGTESSYYGDVAYTSGGLLLTSIEGYIKIGKGTAASPTTYLSIIDGGAATFSSSVTAGGGSAITINSSDIYTPNANSEDDLLVNRFGYNGGTTQFRNFRVYDGKSNVIFRTFGSSGNCAINSNTDAGYKLDVNGTGRFSGILNINNGLQFRWNGVFRGQIIDYNSYGGGGDYSPFITSETSLAFGVGGNTTKALNIASSGAATFSSSVSATAFFESSSILGKDIIATNPLLALDIDVIKYTRKSDESKDIRYGYSAEQIHSLMPELTDKDVSAVKYLDVHTILIAQLQQEIKELKAKLN